VGLFAVALAAFGAWSGAWRDGRGRFFVVLAAVGLWLTIRGPGKELLSALPLFNVGHGIRWALCWSFCVAVLVGFGIEALFNLRPRSRTAMVSGLVMAAGALAALGIPFGIFMGIRFGRWDETLLWAAIDHDTMQRLFDPSSL